MNIKLKKITKHVFILFVLGLGIVLPLYTQDNYFNIMESKYKCFTSLMLILVLPIIILLVLKKETFKYNKLFTYLLFLFLITTGISTLLSDDITNSFFGYNGWYIGYFTVASTILSIMLFKDIEINKYLIMPVIITISLVYLFAILHSFEIDIFQLHSNILEVSYHKYLTTIGNINWYTGYLALTVPVFVGMYLNAKDVTCLIYFCASTLGLLSIALLGSDGIFLGFGLVSLFIIPYIFKDKIHIKRFSHLVFVFSIGLIIARHLDYCMDGYAGMLRRNIVILPIIALAILLFVYSTFVDDTFHNKIAKNIIMFFEFTIIFVAIVFVFIALKSGDSEWGTGRIAIWGDSLKIYFNLPAKDRWFGIGLEQLYTIYKPLGERYGGVYLSSHSEFIQLLLTGGVINLVIYMSLWILVIIKCIKTYVLKRYKLLPIYFGLICYLGQSFVNSATTTNVATLALLIIYLLSNEKLDSSSN